MLGFSTNPLNPVDPSTDRIKFFDFDVGRLFNRAGSTGSLFPSYHDVYGQQPFVYFSSNKRSNGYDPAGFPSLSIAPFAKDAAKTQFYMPDSFQLVSAGADGKFGPGGFWTEANASTIPVAGRDDIVQFRDRAMGIP